jgi:hypothetical protein
MSKVSTYNEWDPLEKIIIGRIKGAQYPRVGKDLLAIESSTYTSINESPGGIQTSYIRLVTLAREIDLAKILFERARQMVTVQ